MNENVMASVIVVSGIPRSGTSLMMRILRDSGIPVNSDEGWSFELKAAAFLGPDPRTARFIRDIPKGSAVKILYPPLDWIPMWDNLYTIIWMRRNARECAKSLRKLGGRPRSYIAKAAKNIGRMNQNVPARFKNMPHVVGLVTVKFEELLRDAKFTLRRVEDLLGVPLDGHAVAERDPAFSGLPLGTLETR